VPAISVIIPIYNTEATLPRCIDSVLAQSFTDYEIILVDDGTPDGAGRIADDYATRHSCITVIHQQNQGLAEARHAGIRKAQGQYVMHVDSDDTLPPDSLEFLHDKAISLNLDIAYGGYHRIPENGKRYVVFHRQTGLLTGDDFLSSNLLVGCLFASWGCISKKELWEHDVFPSQCAILPSEDSIINIKLSEFAGRVGVFNHVVYNYYFNPKSLSITGKLSKQNNWKFYFDEIESNLSRRNLLTKYNKELHTLKIDRFAFYIHPLDTSQEWVSEELSAHLPLPLKHSVLRFMLHWPKLCHFCVTANRWAKNKLLHIYR
jgi:glycosyltransferase involved in cell wall biosynthesis